MISFKLAVPFTLNLLIMILVSLAFARINRRLGCLSYCIPVLYIAYKMFYGPEWIKAVLGLPYKELIILTGILHVIEGILILTDTQNADRCIVTYKSEQLAGGYQTYKKWVVPLLLFCYKGFYIPGLAVLMYANESFTMRPEKKNRLMGSYVAVYGGIVAGAGYLAVRNVLPLFMVMLCMPLMHEGMFWVSRWIETRKLLYGHPKRGVRVIEVRRGVDGDKQLVKRGDVILKINQRRVDSAEEYFRVINGVKGSVYLRVKTLEGKHKDIVCSLRDIKEMGIVVLPEQ